MTPEERARATIDCLLTRAGWKFGVEEYAPGVGRSGFGVEEHAPGVGRSGFGVEEYAPGAGRSGFGVEEYAPGAGRSGFADYILYDEDGTAVGLLEAKSAEKDALAGKEQARMYAASLGVGYVILSNGERHYLWDTRGGDPKRVLALPAPAELANLQRRPAGERARLWTTRVTAGYLKEAAGSDIEMRGYQVEAINAIQRRAQAGDTAFLLEMATGTGKTTVAAGLCFLYLNTGNAQRILFLVDRIELRRQAKAGINAALKGQYVVRSYDGDAAYDWERTQITVATVQSVDGLMIGSEPIAADWFDLIVADEAHRCISGPNHRQLFEGLHAEKIGLTATPRTFVGEPAEDDASPAARERRALRDTYLAFGLPPGEPTYAYTIAQGVTDGYLVGPTAVDVRTEVTGQLMSDEGYQVTLADYERGGDDFEVAYRAGDFARTFLSPGTNDEFARVYLEEALREPGTDLIGKGIIYAVNQRHAAALTQALNKAASARWPGRYQSDFAVQVTSEVNDANDYGERFKNNVLNGRHPENSGYATSKTRVCVTVAMMTTGYDCPDLLNIGVCRPIKSPVDFTQIKGRGTRRYDFRENYTDRLVRREMAPRPKEKFKIIDFFGVCEYHHETEYYEPRISIPSEWDPGDGDGDGDGGGGEPRPNGKGVHIRYGDDHMESATQLEFADDARRIADRRTIYNIREELRLRLEDMNATVAAAFAEYLARHPVEEAHLDDALTLFEAYATDAVAREAIDGKRFALLTGTTITQQQYNAVPTEHRERIPGYVREHLLNDERAA